MSCFQIFFEENVVLSMKEAQINAHTERKMSGM